MSLLVLLVFSRNVLLFVLLLLAVSKSIIVGVTVIFMEC